MHSSRRAWQVIYKKRNCPISLNIIAKQLVKIESILDHIRNSKGKSYRKVPTSDLVTLCQNMNISIWTSLSRKYTQLSGNLSWARPQGLTESTMSFLCNQSGDAMISWLTSFLNACYQNNRIPRAWHHANVIDFLNLGNMRHPHRAIDRSVFFVPITN